MRRFENTFIAKHFPLFTEWSRSFTGDKSRALRAEILNYYARNQQDLEDDELDEAVSYLREKGVHVFSYPFIEKHYSARVKVYSDVECGLKYVLHDGHRLYFKRGLKSSKIRRIYKDLLCEQDEASAHRYLTADFNVEIQDTVLDIGAAEGIFALSVIDKVRNIYLFEVEEDWIEPLEKTFTPWKDRVKIIPKYVSNVDSENTIKVDTFIEGMDISSLFIKIDVEGAEKLILEGAEKAITSAIYPIKLAICTYHQQNDYQELSQIMKDKEYDVRTSKGYMLFHHVVLEPPYFRRGLIYCTSNFQK